MSTFTQENFPHFPIFLGKYMLLRLMYSSSVSDCPQNRWPVLTSSPHTRNKWTPRCFPRLQFDPTTAPCVSRRPYLIDDRSARRHTCRRLDILAGHRTDFATPSSSFSELVWTSSPWLAMAVVFVLHLLYLLMPFLPPPWFSDLTRCHLIIKDHSTPEPSTHCITLLVTSDTSCYHLMEPDEESRLKIHHLATQLPAILSERIEAESVSTKAKQYDSLDSSFLCGLQYLFPSLTLAEKVHFFLCLSLINHCLYVLKITNAVHSVGNFIIFIDIHYYLSVTHFVLFPFSLKR